VTALRSLAYSRGVVMPASPLGKIKMVAQVVAILAIIIGDDHLPGVFALGHAALWVVLAAALVSAADYFRRFNLFANPRPADLAVARERRAARKAS
jgi:CDP-diacylglycerol--glycerol-3-phosphate 3-phosphatidyltransferase